MKVLIEAPFDINDGDKKNIEEKLNKLTTFFNKITQATVYFKKDDGNEPDSILAEVEVHVPGPPIFASASEQQFMNAFNSAVVKVEKQLRKKNDKLVEHH
ncbi:MAG: putative sigma-54 modulation protein [Paraglaciecola sp.]|jgi:putative sigma-54 modulation protein